VKNESLPVIFRSPGFFLMWICQMCGQAGLRMFQIAALWWIVTVPAGGSGGKMGIFMMAAALPSLLFVKLIGRTVDAVRTGRVLLFCAVSAAGILALCSVSLKSGRIGFYGLAVLGFLVALAEAFLDPSFNKAVREVAAAEDLENAVAFQASTQSLANFGGAVAGAMLIDRLGVANVFLLSAAGYLCAGALSRFIKFTPVPRAAGAAGAELSGWGILAGMPLIKKVLIGFGFVNFFVTPVLVIMPLYTSKALGGTASLLGRLEAALWIGLIGGTFLSNSFRVPQGDYTRGAIRLGAFCVLAAGLSLIIPGLLTDRFVYMAALLVTGLSIGVNNVKFITLFQTVVEPAVKGRFFALMQAMIGFSFPVAYFSFGFLADRFSPQTLCLIQGCGAAAVSVYLAGLSRKEAA